MPDWLWLIMILVVPLGGGLAVYRYADLVAEAFPALDGSGLDTRSPEQRATVVRGAGIIGMVVGVGCLFSLLLV